MKYDPNGLHGELTKAFTEYFEMSVIVMKSSVPEDFLTREGITPIVRFYETRNYTVLCESQEVLNEIKQKFIGNWLMDKPVFYSTQIVRTKRDPVGADCD